MKVISLDNKQKEKVVVEKIISSHNNKEIPFFIILNTYWPDILQKVRLIYTSNGVWNPGYIFNERADCSYYELPIDVVNKITDIVKNSNDSHTFKLMLGIIRSYEKKQI